MNSKVKRSMFILLWVVIVIQMYVFLQSFVHDENSSLDADVSDAIIVETWTDIIVDTGFVVDTSWTNIINTGFIVDTSWATIVDTGFVVDTSWTNIINTGVVGETSSWAVWSGQNWTPQYVRVPLGLLLWSWYIDRRDPNRDRNNHVVPCTWVILTGVGCSTIVTGIVLIEPPTDKPLGDPTPIDPPTDLGGWGGGWWGWWGWLHPDDCPDGDLSPSYYDSICNSPIETETPSWSWVKIVFNDITPVSSNEPIPVQCYYNDGQFVVTNYRDIIQSPYKKFIVMAISDCLIHGIADTQRYYHPEQYITQWEVLKMIVRKSKELSPSFNHFARKESYRYRWTPYLTVAERRGMIQKLSTEWSDETMYNKARYNDIINLLYNEQDETSTRFVSRGEFASLLYR